MAILTIYSNTTHGDESNARIGAVTGPKAWNHLPADIRASDSVNSFKTALKTFLFH